MVKLCSSNEMKNHKMKSKMADNIAVSQNRFYQLNYILHLTCVVYGTNQALLIQK